MRGWYIREHNGSEHLWHSYIVYRVRNETDAQVGRLMEIRQVAEAYCNRTASTDLDGTIDHLCWMALERAATWPTFAVAYVLDPDRHDPKEDPDPGLNLLGAAAYLGNMALAKQLLEQGHCPARNNELFDTPLRLAAWAGHADILKLFQEHLPEYERTGTKQYQWRAKTGPGSITGAAIRGDVDMLRLAIYPPSRAAPHSSDCAGFSHGHVTFGAPYDQQVSELYHSVRMTRSLDAFKYICSFFEHGEDGFNLVRNITRDHCEWGNVEIVKYLVDRYGFSALNVYGINSSGRNCLVGAVRGCSEDVLDLLLDRGMNPEDNSGDRSPLDAATSAGSISMVRKLINHGANPDSWGYHLLKNAVRLEHTALLEFLLERNVCRDKPMDRKRVLQYAVERELESMVELMQRWEQKHGV